MSLKKTNVIWRSVFISFCSLMFFIIGFLWSKDAGVWNCKDIQAGGDRANLDMAQDIAVDQKGNVFVTGYSYSRETDFDFITLKYDAQGELIWAERYNGPANSTDYAQDLELDGEGNVYVAGHSNGIGSSLDATIVKYDKDGHRLWVNRYDGPAKRDDYAYAVTLAPDGGIAAAGYSFGPGTEHDYLVLKFRADGRLLWKARYNSPLNRDDVCETLAADKVGNVLVTGVDRTRESSYDMATLKYDAGGQMKWLVRYAGPGQVFDAAEAIGVDPEGNVYVTGYSYSRETNFDFVTVCYDAEGHERWVAKYDGPSHRIDRGLELTVIPTGGVCVAGISFGQRTAVDCLTIRYDEEGNQVWSARYNGTGNGADVPQAITLDPESNVILAGYSRGLETGRDYFLTKYDHQGRQLWEAKYDGSTSQEDAATAMVVDSRGCVYVTGYNSYSGETDFDFVTLKYGPDGHLQWETRYQGK